METVSLHITFTNGKSYFYKTTPYIFGVQDEETVYKSMK